MECKAVTDTLTKSREIKHKVLSYLIDLQIERGLAVINVSNKPGLTVNDDHQYVKTTNKSISNNIVHPHLNDFKYNSNVKYEKYAFQWN